MVVDTPSRTAVTSESVPETGATPTILVIDDSPTNLKVLELILRKNGYETRTAPSGPEGRAIASEIIPDLILLDIMMPDEDGYETCSQLLHNPATMNIPIIFISGIEDVAGRVKGLNQGAVDFIGKPFVAEDVLARTRIHLKLSRANKALIHEQRTILTKLKTAQEAVLVQPQDHPAARFGVYYEPLNHAGGDFYDVIHIGERVCGYFVSDVAGHDVEASFITSAQKALLRQNSNAMYKPDETMRMMNAALLNVMSGGAHLTAVYTHLNRATKQLTIVGAGHPPVLLLSKGKVESHDASGDILGVFDCAYFESRAIRVSAEDRFFLYTDGLIEQCGSLKCNRDQGIERLSSACRETWHLPVQDAVDQIIQSLFPDDQERDDDLLLLGVDV